MPDPSPNDTTSPTAKPGAAPATGEAPAPVTPVPPKRSPGHRGQDVRDTVAELAARAHEISLEAGSKMASALKDVINAAAGISSFAIESARDLVQYMVRRGQMTQEEADKLIREAEESQKTGGRASAPKAETAKKVVVPQSKPPSSATPSAPAPKAKTASVKAKPAAKSPKATLAKKKPAKAPATRKAPTKKK
jgi:hypothetical protein